MFKKSDLAQLDDNVAQDRQPRPNDNKPSAVPTSAPHSSKSAPKSLKTKFVGKFLNKKKGDLKKSLLNEAADY